MEYKITHEGAYYYGYERFLFIWWYVYGSCSDTSEECEKYLRSNERNVVKKFRA